MELSRAIATEFTEFTELQLYVATELETETDVKFK